MGFVINPCDPFVANKMINGKQITVCWHVDDLKVSHEDETALDWFEEKLVKLHGKRSKFTGETVQMDKCLIIWDNIWILSQNLAV